MASWRVEIRETNGTHIATIDLIDAPGPFNKWESLPPKALLPNSGEFMNQLKRINPEVQPSWYLDKFDIDDVSVGSTGVGEILENDGGTFPIGAINWRVISELDS